MREARVADDGYKPVLAPPLRRNEVNTYLTYPEWSIVHAYEDLAEVMAERSESQFGYLVGITNFWRGLCAVGRHASARGTITSEIKAMLYIIGASLNLEFGIKGAYENTIGRAAEWWRGASRTPEDVFAIDVARDYAAFLRQTPWYEFPFGAKLTQLWRLGPQADASWGRRVERKLALSLEFGAKAAYAKLIGALAGAAPAKLRMHSVVSGVAERVVVAGPDIKIEERRSDGSLVVETPRYRAFTQWMQSIVAQGGTFVEIAGNDDVFVTVLEQQDVRPAVPGRLLLSVPLQGREGWRRAGYELKVGDLSKFLRAIDGKRAVLEHLYDY